MADTSGAEQSDGRPRRFGDVDASGHAGAHADYLDRLAGMMDAPRQHWFEYLNLCAGDVVLDAGTGMGEVARMLAARVAPGGRVIGVDLSVQLVERARARAVGAALVEYQVADLTALPFEAEMFDAAYSERVFVWLSDPDAAMAELFRVLRPGGRLVVIDPDHTRVATDADDWELADRLVEQFCRDFPNPRSGRRLRSQAVRAGFVDVAVEAIPRVTTDRDHYLASVTRPLEERLDELIADGTITRERADAYLADQQARAAEGRFLVSAARYLIKAIKPGG